MRPVCRSDYTDYLDWRTQYGCTANSDRMLTRPLVIHYYDEVFQGEGIALRGR
jgi:hypothetical protein